MLFGREEATLFFNVVAKRYERGSLVLMLRARALHLSEPGAGVDGVGHERDSTVLDEVAHQRFDTPSKLVVGVQALIRSAPASRRQLDASRRGSCAHPRRTSTT